MVKGWLDTVPLFPKVRKGCTPKRSVRSGRKEKAVELGFLRPRLRFVLFRPALIRLSEKFH